MRTVTRVIVIYRHPAASVIVGRLDEWQVAQRADRTGGRSLRFSRGSGVGTFTHICTNTAKSK